MKEFVNQSASEGFDGGELLFVEYAELGMHALQFVLADLFGLALQRHDGGSDVYGTAPLMEALDLSIDERLGIAGLCLAFSNVRGGHLLQIVDVVNKYAVNLVHR